MRPRKRGQLLAVAGVAFGLLLSACTSGNSAGEAGGTTGSRVNGGTATVALTPADGQFDYIFPLLDFTNDINANIAFSQELMWRPLYWSGSPGNVGINEKESLADPASITASGGRTIATIQLKPYRWSDGKPVTSRDVQFWINLVRADKIIYANYKPGEFPDNVTSFQALSPSRFTLTFNHPYSASWLYNQLALIIPIPQHAWDRESVNGPVQSYDLSASGALAVDNFLLAQNKDLSSYATNPLWQVVDGPWKLIGYASSTGDASYVRNPAYSGPATGSLHAIKVLSYTSDTAEFDGLLSASGIDVGYIPFNDAAQVSRVQDDGYSVAAWPNWGITYIYLNFDSPQAGAIFGQLYIRQAMQHLINQAGYISSFLQGYGYPTYGPVPLLPASTFVSALQKQNPDPYNPAVATALLRSHGWVTRNGTDTCARPGRGPSQCGAGIPSGASLSFPFLYSTGTQAIDEEVATLQSSFGQAGIKLLPSGAPFNTVAGELAGVAHCNKPSCYQMGYVGESWFFGGNEPDGGLLFGSNAPGNFESYSDPKADALIGNLGSGGIPALYAYQNYLATQLPGLWMPEMDSQISAVTSKLKGVLPQDPVGNIYPEDWYFVK
jgi:peptide/nickel transport system substrate-binding protein